MINQYMEDAHLLWTRINNLGNLENTKHKMIFGHCLRGTFWTNFHRVPSVKPLSGCEDLRINISGSMHQPFLEYKSFALSGNKCLKVVPPQSLTASLPPKSYRNPIGKQSSNHIFSGVNSLLNLGGEMEFLWQFWATTWIPHSWLSLKVRDKLEEGMYV